MESLKALLKSVALNPFVNTITKLNYQERSFGTISNIINSTYKSITGRSYAPYEGEYNFYYLQTGSGQAPRNSLGLVYSQLICAV